MNIFEHLNIFFRRDVLTVLLQIHLGGVLHDCITEIAKMECGLTKLVRSS